MRHCPEVREVLSVCRPRSSARRERNARRTKECQCPCSCLSLSAYGGSVSEVGRQGPDGPAKDTRHMLLHGARCLSRIERSQASPAKKSLQSSGRRHVPAATLCLLSGGVAPLKTEMKAARSHPSLSGGMHLAQETLCDRGNPERLRGPLLRPGPPETWNDEAIYMQ